MTTPAPPLAASGWSSSLSVAEHAAIREAGFTPRGLVMGSSVYKLGISYSPSDYFSAAYASGWGGNRGPYGRPAGAYGGYRMGGSFPGWYHYYSPTDLGFSRIGPGRGNNASWGSMGGPAAVCWERFTFEDGIEHAASLALERIHAETVALGAHGVIGTRLAFRYLEGLPSTLEFTALGTAITRPGAPPLARPFTSHLDGQALLKLLRAGLVPVAVGVGAGSVQASMTSLGYGGVTMELRPFGDAIEASRRIAGEHLVRQARAEGWAVLGTLASTSMYGEGGGQVMTAVLTGTVVRRFATGSWERLPIPIMRLSKP